MQSLVARKTGPLHGRTTFTGMLQGADKCAVLANAEILVLPTRGENFGIAVAEALAHRTPCGYDYRGALG